MCNFEVYDENMPKIIVKQVKKKVKVSRKPKAQDLLRQKNLARLLVEDRGKTPVGKLMLKAGYAKAYSHNPHQMKKTLSWQELMDKNLPDSLLSTTHNELMTSATISSQAFDPKLKDKEIKTVIESTSGCRLLHIVRDQTHVTAYFSVPDGRIRKDAVDMAYKLKGKYPKGQAEEPQKLIIEVKRD